MRYSIDQNNIGPLDWSVQGNWSVQKYIGPTRRPSRSSGAACSCAASTASSQMFLV